MTSHARSHLFVRLSFIAATIVVTWPLVLRMNQGVPYGGDASQFIWNGWWFAKAASDPDLSLWWTPYQYAPHGASLVLHDLSPLNAAIQALLRGSIGDFAAYNVLILFHYILAAWGAYILSYYLTGNRPASVVAGVIYGFSAHHAMHLSQLSTVSNGWIPLAVYYLLKYTRDSGPRDGVMSVLMILAAALSHWYSLVFTAVVFFGFMLIGQVGLRDDLGGTRRWLRALSVWILSGLILSPLLVAAWLAKSTVKVEWLVEMGRLYVLDPIRLILPPPANPGCRIDRNCRGFARSCVLVPQKSDNPSMVLACAYPLSARDRSEIDNSRESPSRTRTIPHLGENSRAGPGAGARTICRTVHTRACDVGRDNAFGLLRLV
jgi:hypothetical protein